MKDNLFVVGLIPARGGSKKILRKNIRLMNGKPLLAYTVITALECSFFDRIILSTDDYEISEIGSSLGVEVPFIRPSELAEDSTPDLPVLLHTINWFKQNETRVPDVFVWLRPTSPLRRSIDIENGLDIFHQSNADFLRSVCITENHPYWMKVIEDGKLKPFLKGYDEQIYFQRQLLPSVYRINGAVDIMRTSSVQQYNQLYVGEVRAYIMSNELSVDVDTDYEWQMVEKILKERE